VRELAFQNEISPEVLLSEIIGRYFEGEDERIGN
jgi:hypothetical protein